MAMTTKKGKWNPARLFDALGRIGYHPVSALLDIADNSISANATKVNIEVCLTPTSSETPTRKRRSAVIDSFLIYDDGAGMDEEGLDNALTFGSSNESYAAGTLSKFGLGLKSAASSLGKNLEIISRSADGICRLANLDRDKIILEYSYDIGVAPAAYEKMLNDYVGVGSTGTIVKISNLHQESLTNHIEITKGLQQKIGIIFYYLISKEGVSISVDGKVIDAIDPLFRDEVSEDLDARTWDGLKPAWILKSNTIQIDTNGCVGELNIVQLPHPPSISADESGMTQAACRAKYMIGAGNYGVYIYRNNRLISWADSLDGMIPQDQDLYSFRGCLLLSSDADDVLNLDVTKSRIHLSEIAKTQIKPTILEAKKQSAEAWNNAKRTLADKLGSAPKNAINEQLDSFEDDEERAEEANIAVQPKTEQSELKQRKKEIIDSAPKTEAIESEKLKNNSERVQFVNALDNNQLWEKAFTVDGEIIVRVNQGHRFHRDLVDNVKNNPQLEMILNLFYFALAKAEFNLAYESAFETKMIDRIMLEFRELFGEEMSKIIKKIDLLPILS